MVPPRTRRSLSGRLFVGLTAATLFAFIPQTAMAQHGHAAGGGHFTPMPHVSAPPPRTPAARPVASPPRPAAPVASRPLANRFVPPPSTALGFRGRVTGPPVVRRPIFPRRPVYYPIFYPVGIYPGFGFGPGFNSCSPFWGWNFGCGAFDYGDSLYAYPPAFGYDGPAEPDYIPVPSDHGTTGDEDEAVLYLKDGTIYLISDYWLANNQIHYVTGDGAEHTIDLAQVDLQQTVNVNANRGVNFTLRPEPTNQTPAAGNAAPTQ
jgi:hypothetical protein